jgi:hypothetical protein
MGFQTVINATLAPGLPGSHHGAGLAEISAYIAANDLVPGTFAVNKAGGTVNQLDPKQAGYHTAATGGVIAGLVTRDSTGMIMTVREEASEIINKGLEVQIAAKGEFIVYLVEAESGTAKIGDRIAVLDQRTGVPTVSAGPVDTAIVDKNSVSATVTTPDPFAVDWWITDILDASSGMCAISTWRQG